MRKGKFARAGARALAALLAAGLLGAAWADARLDDLKKRKAELDRLASECAAMEGARKDQCLAARQKKVDRYKTDLEAYKADLSKASAQEETLDYQAAIAAREKSIKEFTDYLAGCSEKSNRCAAALYQAATLTYQKEELQFLLQQAKYEKDMQAWEDRDRRGSQPVFVRRNHNASLQLFQRFLQEYPSNKEIPDVLYAASFVADMQGNGQLAFEYLSRLADDWKNHPLTTKAHLRLGEYWFLKREYAKAIEQYSLVPLDYPGVEAGLALYHRAEAYYNMAAFEEAARWYYEYVTRADAGKIHGDLREEALSFMAACWADLDNGFDVASRFLGEHGNPSWEDELYFQIGMKNKSHDRLDEALKSFRFLLRKNPTFAKAPLADLTIVEILVLQKKPAEAQKARMDLAQRYAVGSEWYRKNADNKEAVREADKAVHLVLYQIPVYYHQKSELGDSGQTLIRLAEEGYRNYLNRFPDEMSWDVYQVHQNLAVLYTKLGNHAKAASEWRWCATTETDKLGKVPGDKKNLFSKEDAGYNAVLMMDEARKAALKGVYNGDTAAAFKGPETRAYLDYVDWFTRQFAGSPAIAEVAYNAAILNYEARQYDAAISSLSDVIARFPEHPRTVLIRRALAQSMLQGGKYDEASKQFLLLQSKLCPFDSQCAEIKKSLASTLYKQAETKQKSGDYGAATQKFLELANRREEGISDKALFDAAISADSSGKPEDAARYLLRIPQDYPKSELRVRAMLKAASIYMGREKYREAADVFLRLQRDFPNNDSVGGIQALGWAADAYQKGKNPRQAGQTFEAAQRFYPGHPKTPGYLYNAGQIYEGAKWYGDAIEIYRQLHTSYPASQYAAEAMFAIPQLLEKQGDKAKATQAYLEFAAKYPAEKEKAMQARLNAGKNYEGLGEEKAALEQYAKCVALQQGSELPPDLASEAAYRAGDIYYKKVAAIRLDGTKAQNDGRIKGMQENLIPALQNYAKAVELAEEEWALRATLRMGDLFSTIAIISDNQRVAGLSGEDRYRVAIEGKVSVPNYLDKAQELYKKNLEIGLNQNLESPWIDTAGIRLMEAFAFKGRALEELAQLFLNVPLPEGVPAEDLEDARQELKQAAEQQKSKAVETYRDALEQAQIYYLDNSARARIMTRLRALDPASPELEYKVPAKPQPEARAASEVSK